MKSSFRILAIGLALALLLVVPVNFGGTVSAVDIDLDNNEAAWSSGQTDTGGDLQEATFFGPGAATSSVSLYLRSDSLQTTETSLAFTSGMISTNSNSNIEILKNSIVELGNFKDRGFDLDENGGKVTRRYDTGTPANTPVTGNVTIYLYDGTRATSTYSGYANGQVIDPTSGRIRIDYVDDTPGDSDHDFAVIEFSYDIVDMYETTADTEDGDVVRNSYTSGYQRARVTSNSDGSGEWVLLKEVDGVGDDAADPKSDYFMAETTISDDPDDAGGADGLVWVQDGDTLTATIYSKNNDTDSTVIATATVSIDAEDPVISGLTPVDGSILSKSDEVISISFDISDSGAGFDISTPKTNVMHVRLWEDTDEDGDVTGSSCVLTKDHLSFPSRTRDEVGAIYAPETRKWADSPCASVVNATGLDDNHHGREFALQVTAVDLAGNTDVETVVLRLDTVAPSITDVSAGTGWDSSDKKTVGKADSILIEFNESLDPATVSEDDFDVAGFQITAADVVGVNADEKDDSDNIVMAKQDKNEYVALTLSEDLDQNSRPNVGIVGSIADEAGNTVSGTASKPKLAQKAQNKLKPGVTVEAFTALLGDDGEQAISFTADEPLRKVVDQDRCTCVSISGGTFSTDGLKADGAIVGVSLATTMEGTAKFKESRISDTGAYGVIVQATDYDGNASVKGAVSVTDEDVSNDNDNFANAVMGGDTFIVTPAKWPIADSDADGTIADEFKVTVGGGSAVSATATNVDWGEGGKVTLEAPGASSTTFIAKGANVKLTYKYVDASQVIQVDTDAPTVDFEPKAGSTIEHQRPIIQIMWDDAEYAGDTHKTVTLTAATLKGPDGETVDIMDMLETTDNKDWVYAPADALALGEYTLSVSADDEAGNSKNKQTAKYTIKARPKTTVALRAGWNLVSLRGAPASVDINDVITAASVEVVSTYDASLASPWTVWTRDADGALMSTPAGRNAINPGHGLWVRSSNGEDLKVDIPGLSRDDLSTLPPIVELSAGWNLVAASSVDPGVKTLDPDVYFHGLEWVRVYEYDTLTGRLEGALPMSGDEDTDNDDFIDIGKGYWVYLSEPGTLVP